MGKRIGGIWRGKKISMIAHSRPTLKSADYKVVRQVMESGMVAEGEKVNQFEETVSDYVKSKGGVATSSGTAAIYVALRALDVKDHDDVILPSYVCRSVMDAVRWTGARPVLCDIGNDWCMNIRTVKGRVSKRTKAIIMVHIFGIAGNVRPICRLGIPVIENICQAFGAKRDGKFVGTFGEMAVCSFHATKLLTTGEGGMVLANDEGLMKRLKELKYGGTRNDDGRYMFRMSDIQAALGLSQLKKFNWMLTRRREIADHYFSAFNELPIELPRRVRDHSVFFRFPIRTERGFSDLQAEFGQHGVAVRKGVDDMLHRHLSNSDQCFPYTQRMFNSTVSIPIYPSLTESEVQCITEATRDVFQHSG
jgi:UDP-4-amino-4-deoxy-L-arabinose-oxoglutarate aminotransferase